MVDRYFIVSSDCHVNEPATLWAERIEPEFRERLPRVEKDAEGRKWSVAEGLRPVRIRDDPKGHAKGQAFALEAKDLDFSERGTHDPEKRIAHLRLDGIDAEMVYPNKGLLMWEDNGPGKSKSIYSRKSFNDVHSLKNKQAIFEYFNLNINNFVNALKPLIQQFEQSQD